MGQVRWNERRAELEAMLATGAGLREIAEHFGCKKHSVAQTMRRFGLFVDAEAARQRRVAFIRSVRERPEVEAKRKENARRATQTPAARARVAAAKRAEWADPEQRRKLYAAVIRTQTGMDPQKRSARSAKGMKTRMAWLPDDRRDHYRWLCQKLRCAKEAKRVILAELERERQAAAKAKAAFDRSYEGQLARVRAGARLETRLTRPANDLTFSPTGSSLAL